MNESVFLIICGMTLVTYIPRALPAAFIDKLRFPPRVEKFLRLIPYTALAAMIFPGVLTVDAARWEIGFIGAAAAVLLAWRKASVLLCVAAAIAAVMLCYFFL